MAGSLPPQYRSLTELQKAYHGGTTTVAAVTEQYLAAIESLQSLNAITVVNPKAVEEAAKLDVSLTSIVAGRVRSAGSGEPPTTTSWIPIEI